jgi:hypothetical protein
LEAQRAFAGILAALGLAGCVAPGPVVVSLQYAPPEPLESPSLEGSRTRSGPACSAYLADVRDLREDPQSLGAVAEKSVQGKDAAKWVYGAIRSLETNPTLRFTDAPASQPGGLTLQVDLLKAYIMSVNTARTAVVVIKVHYSRDGSPLGDAVHRGSDTGMLWSGNAGESANALNMALSHVLTTLRPDILAHCQLAKAAPPTG